MARVRDQVVVDVDHPADHALQVALRNDLVGGTGEIGVEGLLRDRVTARRSSTISAILRTTRSRSTTTGQACDGLRDEAAFEVEIPSIVVVALEGGELELPKIGRGAVQQAAVVRHFLEEEGIGVVEDGEIDLAIGE